jgi:hypothetical protein
MALFSIPDEEHLREIISRKKRAARTQRSNVSALMRLRAQGHKLWDVDATLAALSKFKPNTVRGYISALCVLLNEFPEQAELNKRYHEELLKVNKGLQEAAKEDPRTESQKENWKEWEQVVEKKGELEKEVTQMAEEVKEGKKLNERKKVIMYRHLLLSLYTEIPPQRCEYGAMRFLTEGEPVPEGVNCYVLGRQRDEVLLQQHKTLKFYGKRRLPVPPSLSASVRRSLQLEPRLHLISAIRNPNEAAGENRVSSLLGRLWPGLGCNLLRKICKTEWSEKGYSNAGWLAESMGHSLDTAETYYNADRRPLSANTMFEIV